MKNSHFSVPARWAGLSCVVLGATLASTANAQTSSVSIGGIVDAAVRHDWGSDQGGQTGLVSGQMAASRITIAGEEQLGGQLKAGFVLESGLSLDSGTGHANPPGVSGTGISFGRTSALSLGTNEHGFLSVGRQYTPLWSVTGTPANDPFSATWLGGTGTLFNTTIRVSNSIVFSHGYGSRAMIRPAPVSGLGFALMYGLPEASGGAPSRSGQQMGFNLSYGAPQWWVGYGFHQVRGSNEAMSTTALITDMPKLQQQVLGASVLTGRTRWHVSINTGKTDNNSVNTRAWYAGINHPLNDRHVLRVSYGRSDDRTSVNADFRALQLGYQYLLSRRSSLYATYGFINNSDSGKRTFSNAMGTYSAGATAQTLALGMRHNF